MKPAFSEDIALLVRIHNEPAQSAFRRDRPNDDPEFLHRYANALLDAFPTENDQRPARALENWRDYFCFYVTHLRNEITAWKLNPALHGSLTGLVWTLAERIHANAGQQFVQYDTRTRKFHLRFGLMELAKLLCRDAGATGGMTAAERGITRPDDRDCPLPKQAGELKSRTSVS